jgi:invasion protein IalB
MVTGGPAGRRGSASIELVRQAASRGAPQRKAAIGCDSFGQWEGPLMIRAIVLVATYLAFPGSAAEAADPRAIQLTYEPWSKTCIAETCFVSAGVRGACAPSGGSVGIVVQDGKSASVSAYFATKRMPQGAVSVQVDQDAPIPISNPRCHGSSCGGKIEIDTGFIERLKRSQTVTIEAKIDQSISFSFPLAGFAQAYDRPGTEPRVHEDILSTEEMEELMKRSEEQRKAFECKE